jgi:DNA-binding PucR family transcriptional regulator
MFADDRWNAEIYDSLSLASRISALLKANGQAFKVLWFMRRLNAALNIFFSDIHAAIEGRVRFEKQSGKPVTISEVRYKLTELHRLTSAVYESGRKSGFTNNSFLSLSFRKLRRHTEGVEDLIDWLDALDNEPETRKLFERAEREARMGELFDTSKVR